MKRLLSAGIAALLALATPLCASAALNPVFSYVNLFGTPGSGRMIAGNITFGPNDTYTAGGLNILPSNIGGGVAVRTFITDSPAANFETVENILTNGSVQLSLSTVAQGVAAIAATSTTVSYTVSPALLGNNAIGPNTVIQCILDDAATGGGGTGTWATTAAISSCKYTGVSTFLATATAAAPTGGGNFTWTIPGVSVDAPVGTPVGSLTIPFVAIVQ